MPIDSLGSIRAFLYRGNSIDDLSRLIRDCEREFQRQHEADPISRHGCDAALLCDSASRLRLRMEHMARSAQGRDWRLPAPHISAAQIATGTEEVRRAWIQVCNTVDGLNAQLATLNEMLCTQDAAALYRVRPGRLRSLPRQHPLPILGMSLNRDISIPQLAHATRTAEPFYRDLITHCRTLLFSPDEADEAEVRHRARTIRPGWLGRYADRLSDFERHFESIQLTSRFEAVQQTVNATLQRIGTLEDPIEEQLMYLLGCADEGVISRTAELTLMEANF